MQARVTFWSFSLLSILSVLFHRNVTLSFCQPATSLSCRYLQEKTETTLFRDLRFFYSASGFGMCTMTVVPSPGLLFISTDDWHIAYSLCFAFCIPTWIFPSCGIFFGSNPTPSSRISISKQSFLSLVERVSVPPSSLLQIPCFTAFSTSGWMDRAGTKKSVASILYIIFKSKSTKQLFLKLTHI